LSDGEPYAEIEALLAALSAGPVAIGDQIGATDRDLVMRTCRDDGVLVKPDVPLAAVDRCFAANSFLKETPLIGETYSDHPSGRWVYVASFHACQSKDPLPCRIELGDLGVSRPASAVVVYDWRRGTFERLAADDGWACELDFQDWDYKILCPLLDGGVTVFGDVRKYATVSDHHVVGIRLDAGTLQFTLLDRAGSMVEVHGCSEKSPCNVVASVPGGAREIERRLEDEGWSWDPTDGRWAVRARVGANGHTLVRMTFGTD
jgi:hypothetical protein